MVHSPMPSLPLTIACDQTHNIVITEPSILTLHQDCSPSNTDTLLLPTKKSASPAIINHNITYKFSNEEQTIITANLSFNSNSKTHLELHELLSQTNQLRDEIDHYKDTILTQKKELILLLRRDQLHIPFIRFTFFSNIRCSLQTWPMQLHPSTISFCRKILF